MVKSLCATDFGSCHVTQFPHLFSDVKDVKCNCSNFSISQKISKILNNFNVGQKKLLQLLQNYYKNYYMSKSANFYLVNEKMTLVVIENQFYIHDARACACVC